MPEWLVVLALLVVAVLVTPERPRRNISTKEMNLKRKQLEQDILAVQQLIAKNAPLSEKAHKLVTQASKCLVYPDGGQRVVVTTSDVIARYEKGLEYLNEARKAVSEEHGV